MRAVLIVLMLAGAILLFGCVSSEGDYSAGSASSGSQDGYNAKLTNPSTLSDCDIAKDNDDMNICIMFLGRNTKDASVCDRLTAGNYLYECYSGVVLGTGDLSLCDRFGKDCYEIVAAECCAGGRGDSPSVCDELQNKGYDSC